MTAEQLDAALFADQPGERLVAELQNSVSPAEVALRANLTLTQALLSRAAAVAIDAEGNARALVRQAKLGGLICTVAGHGPSGDVRLEVSGPFAVFRHTLLYGRALGRLVPLLAWCRRFRLHATCVLNGSLCDLELRTGDPIFPAAEPRPYDSRTEARFAREFRRLAPDWDVLREPEPVVAGPSLVFPDFALQHRHNPSRRWLMEIVGFWTPEYVRRKLALYRTARIANLILCIDDSRACTDDDLPAEALILRFRRHVDATAVWRLVEHGPGATFRLPGARLRIRND